MATIATLDETRATVINTQAIQREFPESLVRELAGLMDTDSLRELLARYTDADYVEGALRRQLFSFLRPAELAAKRVLDFGCGAGASTFALSRLCPSASVVGVDLQGGLIDTARRIGRYFPEARVEFHASPQADCLPLGLGTFDAIMLSAVYEHLLPNERPRLLRLLWSALRPGGVLLINQTPHRWAPFEHHTTGLWFINYLPDFAARIAAQRFSRETPELNRGRDWNGLLRGGIRGGSEREVLGHLRNAGHPRLLQPVYGARDRAEYWLNATNRRRMRALKLAISELFRMSDRLWDTVPATHLEMAIRKDA